MSDLLPWLDVLTGEPPADAVRVDGRACRTRAGLFAEWAAKLRFPGYFGHNWDALVDCLADRVHEAPLTLVVDEAPHLLAEEPPGQLTTLLEVLDHVARGAPHSVRVLLRSTPAEEQPLRQRILSAVPKH